MAYSRKHIFAVLCLFCCLIFLFIFATSNQFSTYKTTFSGGVSYILHGLAANNVTKSVSAIRDNTSKNVTKSEPFQNNSQIDKDMRLEQLHELTEEDVLKEEQDKKHQEEEQQTKSLQEVQQQKEQLQIAEKKQSLEEKDEKNPAQEEEEQEQKEELHNEQNQKEAEQKTNGAIELAQQPQTCKLKYNIALLKMHKCSSSTVQNILLRFSEKHDLTVIMPPRGNYLGYPSPFNKKFMIQVPWNEYNIYTYHSRFSYKGISEVMPKDTVYMTVLRDPVPMYESSFTYFRIGGRYGLKGSNALEQFLMNPDGYFKSNSNKGRVKNPMLYDLGFDPENMYSMDKIDKKIQEIDSIFKIVLISEYFEESLILLKEIMCWDMEDIVYFKLNSRSANSVHKVSSDSAKKIREFNAGDVKLYNYFNDSLQKAMDKYGRNKLATEVAQLKQRIHELETKCIARTLETSNRVYRPPGLNVQDFSLKPGMDKDYQCKSMTTPELMYTSKVRDKLYAKIREYTAKHAPVEQ